MFGRGRSRPVDDSDLPAGMAWRIHLGRRPICHTQPFIDGPRRLASHLVFPRCAVAIFSTRLHGFANRTLVLGLKFSGISLGKYLPSPWQCASRLVHPCTLESARRMVGWGNLRVAPGSGRIGRLDFGAEESPDGLLFFAHFAGLDRICRSDEKTSLAFLPGSARILFARIICESDRLHVTGSIALDPLAERKTDRLAGVVGNPSIHRARSRCWTAGRLVGEIPSRH